ncbi:PPE domain-containing protein [Mycobacterium sp. URHB0021]
MRPLMRAVKEVSLAELDIDTAAVTQTAATVAGASSSTASSGVIITAPAADPVSAAVAQTLQARCAAVTGYTLLAQAITQARGSVLTSSASTYDEQEQLNASSLRYSSGSLSQGAPPTIPTVAAPQVGTPTTNGKDITTLLHGGPGPAGLYSAAQQMRSHATELQSTARLLHSRSTALTADWQSSAGDQASRPI